MAKIVYKNETIHADISYSSLLNKPSINGHELESGDNSASSLGIVWHGTKDEYDAISVKDPNCMYVIQDENHTPISVDTTGRRIKQYQLKRDADLDMTSDYVTEAINGLNERVGRPIDELGDSLTQALNDEVEFIGNLEQLVTNNKENIVASTNEVNDRLGDLSTLTTNNKSSVVAGINDVKTKVGNMSQLTTAKKDTLVNAVNQLNTDLGHPSGLSTLTKTNMVSGINELVKDLGSKTSLTTTKKDNFVNAANETDAQIGDLTKLITTKKDTIVNAINEVKTKISSSGSSTSSGATSGSVDKTKTYNIQIITPNTNAFLNNGKDYGFANYIAPNVVYIEFGFRQAYSTEVTDARVYCKDIKVDGKSIVGIIDAYCHYAGKEAYGSIARKQDGGEFILSSHGTTMPKYSEYNDYNIACSGIVRLK